MWNTSKQTSSFPFRPMVPVSFGSSAIQPTSNTGGNKAIVILLVFYAPQTQSSTQPTTGFHFNPPSGTDPRMATIQHFMLQYQGLTPIGSNSTPYFTQPTSTTGFFLNPQPQQTYFPGPMLQPNGVPNAAGKLAIAAPDIFTKPPAPRSLSLCQPDYSDPHGVKSFVASRDSTNGELYQKNFEPTYYDNDDLLRISLSINATTPTPSLELTRIQKPQIENRDYGIHIFKGQSVVGGSMYDINEKLNKSRDMFTNLSIKGSATEKEREKTKIQLANTATKTKKEATQYTTTISKYNEDTLSLHITATFKGQEHVVRVRIHKTYTVKDVIEETHKKIKGIIKNVEPKNLKLLKASLLLHEEYSLADSKLVDDDRLFLVIDKNLEGESSSEGEDGVENDASNKQHTTPKNSESKKNAAKGKKRCLAANELIPKLKRKDYELVPDYASLCRMTEEELMVVENFTVKSEFGQIIFEGKTDVRGLDLDEIIEIRHEEIVVYSDDDNKPEVGQQLNKPATIHLYGCKPKDRGNADKEKFVQKLMKISKKQHVIIIYVMY